MTDTTENRAGSSRIQALLKLLEFTSTRCAKVITYTTALLGIAALYPGIQLPTGLEVLAGGLGVNIISDLLERIAHNDTISGDEMRHLVESAISSSGIDKLLTKDGFFHAYSHLLKHQRSIANTSDEILDLLRRLETRIVPTSSGLSYSDARQIAQDVFDANMYRLAGDAYDAARVRAENLINSFLAKLLAANATALASAADPDFQYVLFLAQQTYARSGDQKMLDVLANLLVERASSTEFTFLRVAQNEACAAISKLTVQHFNALSLLFLIREIGLLDTDRLDILVRRFRTEIQPVLESLPESEMSYEYLENLGCVKQIRDTLSDHLFRRSTDNAFEMRFARDEVEFLIADGKACEEFFQLEPGDFTARRAFQLVHGTREERALGEYGAQVEVKRSIPDMEAVRKLLMPKHPTAPNVVEEWVGKYARLTNAGHESRAGFLEAVEPGFVEFNQAWTHLRRYSLTAVGMVIATSNLKRITGENYNILRWIR